MHSNDFGDKLRTRMSALLAEHRARTSVNAQTAQTEYAAAESEWNHQFAVAKDQAVADLREATQSAQERRSQDLTNADHSQATKYSDLSARIQSAYDALRKEAQKIPGVFGTTTEHVTANVLSAPPSHAVVGRYLTSGAPEEPVPVIVPLVGSKGLLLRGNMGEAHNFVDALFARLIATIPLSSLNISVFDPEIGGLLSAYSGLRAEMGERYPLPSYDADGLRRQLESVLAAVQKNTDRVRSLGQRNILSIWENATPKLVLNVVVVVDSPGSMDESVRGLLRRVIDSGPASGALVILLQTGDRDAVVASQYDERTSAQIDGELYSPGSLTPITFDELPYVAIAHLPQGDVTMTPIGGMTHLAVQELISQALVSQSQQGGPIVGPERMAHDGEQASAATGIEIALGERENGSPLNIRLRSENPPLPNALIGGDVGTGKSNLLHSLIYAIAAKYSREEVEVMLLDFKSGTEFQRYVAGNTGGEAHWLPNASIIGLESDRAFGLAVLKHLSEELDRRANVFKLAGANGYDAYRRDGHQMPRLVALIDEFQTLFEDDDQIASDSVQLLSNIMRKGRAFGVHLVLSTQTLTGIRQLSTQGDAIFAQVPVRIALRLGRTESQVMLANGNLAASRLQHRGEVVVNERSGEGEENNQTGVVTHAEIGYTTQLQSRLWTHAAPTTMPRLFRGTVYAPRQDSAPAPRSLMLGETVDVAGTPVVHAFGQDPLRALAIVGSDLRTSSELINSVLLSGYRCGSYERVVVVGSAPVLETAAMLSRQTGITTDVVDYEQAAQWIVTNADLLRAARTLVVVADMQRIISFTEELTPAGEADVAEESMADLFAPQSSTSGDDFTSMFGGGGFDSAASGGERSASSVVAGLAQQSSSRSDLVVSCQLFSTVENVFGYDRQGGNGIAAYALAQVPTEELRGFFGHGVEQPEKSPRMFYTRAGTGAGGALAIPYGTED